MHGDNSSDGGDGRADFQGPSSTFASLGTIDCSAKQVNYVLVTGDNEIIAATDKHIEFFAPKSAANSALRSPSGALSLSAFDIDWVQTRPAIALDMCTALALVDPTRNRLLISAQANGLIRLIDLTANSEVWRLDSRLGRVHSISNSSDGKYIATVHWRQTVVWDL